MEKPLTVAELIEELKKFPQDIYVEGKEGGDYGLASEVSPVTVADQFNDNLNVGEKYICIRYFGYRKHDKEIT